MRSPAWIPACILLVVAGLGAAGCGCEPEAPLQVRPAGPPDAVEYADGRVSLAVRDALHLSVLEELAAKAGFALEVHGVEARRVSLELDRAPLADAVAALIGEGRYALEYAFDPKVSRHVVVALRVGDAPPPPVARVAEGEEAPPGDAQDRRRRERLERRRDRRRERLADLRGDLDRGGDRLFEERTRELVAEEREAIQKEGLEALSDPGPTRRAEAVKDLDTDDPAAREAVADLGQSDPDPQVRLAAAEALGFDDTYDSKTALRDMLATETDPQVLGEIIDALGDDPSFYDELQACCPDHPEMEFVDPPGE